MSLLLLSLMLTACAATQQDLSGKMFTFPEETNTAHVKLVTPAKDYSALTVCLRSFTDLTRNHILFSLATRSNDNAFLIFKPSEKDQIKLYTLNKDAAFKEQDYQLNAWQSVCSTWQAETGLVKLWLNGKPTIKKFLGGSKIIKPAVVILGQEQDSYGGGFDIGQSFIGMISDVHMWDHVLSSCEIQRYMDASYFTHGNVINWGALEFETVGRVLIENKE